MKLPTYPHPHVGSFLTASVTPRARVVRGLFKGQPVAIRLGLADWRAFERARLTGYLVVHRGRGWLGFPWWAWCEARNQPDVCVQLGPRARAILAPWAPQTARQGTDEADADPGPGESV